jgi:hypothetical protein
VHYAHVGRYFVECMWPCCRTLVPGWPAGGLRLVSSTGLHAKLGYLMVGRPVHRHDLYNVVNVTAEHLAFLSCHWDALLAAMYSMIRALVAGH